MQLEGIGALVTGGGHGLGRGIAEALARQGASVVVCGRNRERLEETVRALASAEHMAHALVCDVTDESSVTAAVTEAEQRVGGIDLLVNNAGIAPTAPLTRMKRAIWDEALAVNATGPFLCTRACLPGMLERGRGRIVNVASIAGVSSGPYLAAYSASKHAVVGLTRAAAAELGSKGVHVNALCPGYVDTAMTQSAIERAMRKGLDEAQALHTVLDSAGQQRLLTVGEVSAWVVHLAGPAGDALNGQVIVLDGGGSPK